MGNNLKQYFLPKLLESFAWKTFIESLETLLGSEESKSAQVTLSDPLALLNDYRNNLTEESYSEASKTSLFDNKDLGSPFLVLDAAYRMGLAEFRIVYDYYLGELLYSGEDTVIFKGAITLQREVSPGYYTYTATIRDIIPGDKLLLSGETDILGVSSDFLKTVPNLECNKSIDLKRYNFKISTHHTRKLASSLRYNSSEGTESVVSKILERTIPLRCTFASQESAVPFEDYILAGDLVLTQFNPSVYLGLILDGEIELEKNVILDFYKTSTVVLRRVFVQGYRAQIYIGTQVGTNTLENKPYYTRRTLSEDIPADFTLTQITVHGSDSDYNKNSDVSCIFRVEVTNESDTEIITPCVIELQGIDNMWYYFNFNVIIQPYDPEIIPISLEEEAPYIYDALVSLRKPTISILGKDSTPLITDRIKEL